MKKARRKPSKNESDDDDEKEFDDEKLAMFTARVEQAKAIMREHRGACEIRLGHKGQVVGWTKSRLAQWRRSPRRKPSQRMPRILSMPPGFGREAFDVESEISS